MVIYTAGRIREINNLKWENITEDFLIHRTRKAKNSDIKEVIKAIPRKADYVFINPRTETKYDFRRRLMKSLTKKAKVKHFGFHALRHYGSSLLAQKGFGLTDIQSLLGHERATTTDIYLQSISCSLRKAVEEIDI